MTTAQYLKLYDFFRHQLNVDDSKAKVFIEEVEKIVENKFDEEKNNFSPRTDIQELKYQIELLRQETKTGLAETKSELKSEINKLIVWMIGIIFTAAMVFFALSKYVH
ncbi:MAG: hypothetical protein ACR2FN_11570 [Chitinophagaceae bacterium]